MRIRPGITGYLKPTVNGQHLCPPYPCLKFIPYVIIKTLSFVSTLVEIMTSICTNTCLENIIIIFKKSLNTVPVLLKTCCCNKKINVQNKCMKVATLLGVSISSGLFYKLAPPGCQHCHPQLPVSLQISPKVSAVQEAILGLLLGPHFPFLFF